MDPTICVCVCVCIIYSSECFEKGFEYKSFSFIQSLFVNLCMWVYACVYIQYLMTYLFCKYVNQYWQLSAAIIQSVDFSVELSGL